MKALLIYLETALLSVLIACAALDLRRADLRIPLYYSVGGDVHFHLALTKTVAETGWYLENPWLGAPGSMKSYDFPYAETGTFLGLKLFILLVRDPYLAGNLFFLATFVLAAWTSLFVLRRFEVHDQVAVAASLLFAFAPYHFWKGTSHIHLSAYYPIPLAVMVSLWLCQGKPLLLVRNAQGKLRPSWIRNQTLAVLVACGLISLGGPYSAYFGAFLLLIGGVIGWLRKPCLERGLDGLFAAGLVVGLFSAQLVPFVIGIYRQGGIVNAWNRPSGYYYTYSLWSSNLFRPTVGHRVPFLARFSSVGRPVGPTDLPALYVETRESLLAPALGLVASIGLVFLIVVALASPCPLTRRKPVLGDLSKLNVAALFLCLAGGAGELIALYVTTMIRCYSRISIFLSFFAYFGLALVMSKPQSGSGSERTSWNFLVLLFVGTLLALLDQIPSGVVPDYTRDAALFRSDQKFVRQIEQVVPEGGMIFQLPPNSFPEFGLHIKMYDYNHFRGYLHSNRLRWSYGAMRGRNEEKLHSALAPLAPAPLVDRLVELGFSGIYVNRKGHAEEAREVIKGLLQKIPQAPIQSDDGELLFFRLPVNGREAGGRPNG